MALKSWLVTFLRAGIPNCNHIIVLTIQPQKPLKGEPEFFPSTQGFCIALCSLNPCG